MMGCWSTHVKECFADADTGEGPAMKEYGHDPQTVGTSTELWFRLLCLAVLH